MHQRSIREFLNRKHSPKASQLGSSLIEILISVAVISLILTTVAIGMSFSLQNTASIKYRSMAVQLANEATEALKRESALLRNPNFLGGATSGLICLDTLPDPQVGFTPSAVANHQACPTFTQSRNQYQRSALCVADASGTFVDSCLVKVSWFDGSKQHFFEVSTSLARR